MTQKLSCGGLSQLTAPLLTHNWLLKICAPCAVYSLPLTHTHPPSRLSKWGLGYSLACWAATFAGWFLRLKFQVWRLHPSLTTKSLLLDLGRSSALPKTGRREGRMWGRGMSPFIHQLSAGNPGAQSASLRLIGGRRRPQFSKGRGCCVESSRPQTWAWTLEWLQSLRGCRLGRPRLKS